MMVYRFFHFKVVSLCWTVLVAASHLPACERFVIAVHSKMEVFADNKFAGELSGSSET